MPFYINGFSFPQFAHYLTKLVNKKLTTTIGHQSKRMIISVLLSQDTQDKFHRLPSCDD